MKLVIIFFLSFSILAVYCQAEIARKVEGQIIIYEVDEKGNESSLDEQIWANFYVDLYYRNETGKEFPCKCTDSPNISDKLRFVVTISGKCNSHEFYEKRKELYLKPNFGSKGTPAGWNVETPPPHIILDKNQGDEPYPPNKNLVIRIPKNPKPEENQANMQKAKEEVKQNPGNSITYLWAVEGVGVDKHKFAKKAYDFLIENDQTRYARYFRNQYLKKQKTTQPPPGEIYGSVVLADGSKIPGALVTITGNKIGKMTTTSSAKGDFRFSSLPPGEYELEITLEGFKTLKRSRVKVGLGDTVTKNFCLEMDDIKETIVVTGKLPDVGGEFYGNVFWVDGSKAPGALVTITGGKIGKLTTTSSAKGDFSFSSLPPGEYEFEIKIKGFKTIKRERVKVGLGKTVTMNFSIASEKIEIE